MNKLLIFTEQKSNRLKYIFDLVLTDLMGLEYELTADKESFSNSTVPKFSYGVEPIGSEIFFEAVTLLFETDVKPQPINFCEHGRIQGFFPVYKTNSFLPFDLFASAFFMVTRYEEYLPSKLDKYDRYRGSQSMNLKAGFLDKPMVNLYAQELKKIFSEKFASLVYKKTKFEYIATFDIDMAYSYLEKGLKRNVGGFIKSFFLSDMKDLKTRALVLSGRMKDPFDTYDYIFKVCNEHSITTKFFFLVADESRFDKNIPYSNPKFKKLIKDISQKTDTGIHLSFKSHISSAKSQVEINRLEEIMEEKPTINRYHYLRFHVQSSYPRLVKHGIEEDYSLGYAAHTGFRAGMCTPFYFFNVRNNEQTALRIFPFTFMDATFTHYYRTNNEHALEKIRQLMKSVHEVGGTMIGIWHNSSFTEEKEWKGWRSVFETVAYEATQLMKQP